MKRQKRTAAFLTAVWYAAVTVLTNGLQPAAALDIEELPVHLLSEPFTVTDTFHLDNGQLLNGGNLGLHCLPRVPDGSISKDAALDNVVTLNDTTVIPCDPDINKLHLNMTKKQSGLSVFGNLSLGSGSLTLSSAIPYDVEMTGDGGTAAVRIDPELPYLYVDSVLENDSGALLCENQPYNIMAGALRCGINNYNTWQTNLLLYNPELESEIYGGYLSLGSGRSLICNNRRLGIDCREDSVIGGDLIMTNPESNLDIRSPLTVEGNVYCAGTLNGEWKLTVKGEIYVARGVSSELQTQSAEIMLPSIGRSVPANTDSVAHLTGYQLFPEAMRPDTMFDDYIRLDLGQDEPSALQDRDFLMEDTAYRMISEYRDDLFDSLEVAEIQFAEPGSADTDKTVYVPVLHSGGFVRSPLSAVKKQ